MCVYICCEVRVCVYMLQKEQKNKTLCQQRAVCCEARMCVYMCCEVRMCVYICCKKLVSNVSNMYYEESELYYEESE